MILSNDIFYFKTVIIGGPTEMFDHELGCNGSLLIIEYLYLDFILNMLFYAQFNYTIFLVQGRI